MAHAATRFSWAAWPLICTLLAGLAVQSASAENRAAPPYPPADRPWSSTDYRGLVEMVKSGKVPLPTLADPSSKAVFERVVNVENTALWMARKKDMAVAARMPETLETLQSVNALTLNYVSEANKGKPYEREMAKLLVYSLTLISASIDLAHEFMATMPKDAKYETRMAGFRQMQQGNRGVLAGLGQSIAETKFYSKASTLEMAQSFVTHVPAFQSFLTDADRQDHLRRIEQQFDSTTDADVRAALMSMRAAIGKPK